MPELPALHRLLESALRSGWKLRPPEWEMLADLEYELTKRPRARIAMLVGDNASPLGPVLQAAYPRSCQWVADFRAEPAALHAQLAAAAPYDLIIDDTRRARTRRQVFRNTFLHLKPGGIYLVRDFRKNPWPDGERPVDRALWPYLCELIDRRQQSEPEQTDRRTRDEIHRAEALGRVLLGTEHLIVQNRTNAYAKLRESEMNAAIAAGAGDRASLVTARPALQFRSRATLVPARLYETDRRFIRDFEVPPVSVRRYRDAVVVPQQVALQGSLILPESFRHHLYPRLRNRRLTDLTHYFAAVDDLGTPQRLPGRYFHLDSEYPGHFGHVITEPLSRLWAWPELRRQWPDLKAIVSLPRAARKSPSFAVQLFAAAGVPTQDLVAVNRPVRVDELVGATPMASMPNYIHPDIAALWRRIGDRLAERAADGERPDRIFITRPDGSLRPCHNRAAVEDRFRAAGFTVIRPETLPLPEQVQLFRRASVVAGFGGSGMFNLMFRTRPTTAIIVRPSSYTSVNEYMISSVLGNRLVQIDSVPDVDHPEGGWTWDAFRSGFTFDFDREGRELDDVLAAL
jgi:capsular polysaccharide biosynthesis protein